MIFKRPSDLVRGDVVVVLHDAEEKCWRIKGDPRGTETMERVPLTVQWVIPQALEYRVAFSRGDEWEATFSIPPSCRLELVPEHHPVCGRCGELMPCRELRIADEAKAIFDRNQLKETA